MTNALTTLTRTLATKLDMGDGADLIVKCKADGCAKPCKHPVPGLCGAHYKRMQRAGTLEITRRERGTGTKTSNGYIAIGSGGHKKQEHVLIVERVLGKALPTGRRCTTSMKTGPTTGTRTLSFAQTRLTTSCCTSGWRPWMHVATRISGNARSARSTTPQSE